VATAVHANAERRKIFRCKRGRTHRVVRVLLLGITVGGMGVYEDTIVKVNGEWLIQKREILQ
jgi:hypothetical protein